jgi:hypothetical protein
MARPSSGARSVGARSDRDGGMIDARDDGRHTGRTPAQWYCLLAGAALLLAGVFGFVADATFDTSMTVDPEPGGNANGALQGDSFLGFEVNGWHNLVHLLSGAVLLLAARGRGSAKTVALAFGVVYGVVTVIGLIDGNDVLGLIPVNAADNVLHLALSAVGILAALASPTDERRRRSAPAAHDDREDRFGRDVDPLTGTARDDSHTTHTR